MPRAIRSRAEGDPRILRALADPTRRKILRELGASELRASDVAARFEISRPAISKQLRVLLDAGLVRVRVAGRERHYSIVPGKLRDAAASIQALDAFWKVALAKLGEEIPRRKG